ncbi:Shikimate kinase I [hydrothermal vent metagenome]|uniref:Shikimate kinase I n=1 Tax=hydrothermal vent metagenome TaxID=652676 RepID=A0A1W1BU78_9ZZZZ
MGVGKGTTARAFSKAYNIYNIDTDDLIESKENRKVKKIFAKNGEKYFRKLEQDTANWIESSVSNTLISCGGGFYKVDNLSKLGKVILLDASFEWIYNGLLNATNSINKLKKRPLFSDLVKAEELYNERKLIYTKLADVIITVENKTLDEVISELAEILDMKK